MSFAGKAVLALFWLMLVPWGAGTVFFRKEKTSKPLSLLDFFGGEDGIRTHVRLLAN